MEKSYFGIHINIDKISELLNINPKGKFNLIQIFKTKDKTKDISVVRDFLIENDIKIVIHASYKINIARSWNEYSWWIDELINEIVYADKVGSNYIVLHFGKHLDLSIADAYNNMYSCLLFVHNRTKELSNVKILLETSAGQGTEMCNKLEDLSHFYKKISLNINLQFRDRIKICIDTCHLFVSGYDLSTEAMVKLFLESFEELIGIHHIKLVHFNDSVNNLGSNIDRHANIGKGYIGFNGLKIVFDYFTKQKINILLETPSININSDIKLLKG